jgi:hypothetical protein
MLQMESSKRAKKILLASVLLLLVGAAGFTLATQPIVRCYLVRWSDLDQIAPNVYVGPDMPESQRQTLLSSLADAKTRVATLYGEYTANPVIIAGHTMEVMNTYGGSSDNRAGRAYLTPIAAFIVLGPDGLAGVEDVLPHELAHVEFSARIGHGNRGKIPAWFDEGLAVQFDDRYSESEWRTRTDNGRTAPALDQIGVITHDDWFKYATAKHEVRRWLDVVGQEGFWAFLQSIRNGAGFQEAYRSTEQAYSFTVVPPTPSPTVSPSPVAIKSTDYRFPDSIDPAKRYLFYLHGRIIEEQGIPASSPDYGEYEYAAMLEKLAGYGFVVMSEARPKNTDSVEYAKKIRAQVTTLLEAGVPAKNITVVGASKGAAIAIYVSHLVENDQVNYVIMGICRPDIVESFRQEQIFLTGNVLSIYDFADDEFAGSCQELFSFSEGKGISRYDEVILNVGTGHGILYKPLDEWILPTVQWAKRDW